MMHIGSLLYPQIKLTDRSLKRLLAWSKTFCLKTVHTVVNRLISNSATIQMYDTVTEGVLNIIPLSLQVLKLIIKKIASPSKVVLNKDNIHVAQSALLKAFVCYFHQIFSPNDSPSKTLENAFYFI